MNGHTTPQLEPPLPNRGASVPDLEAIGPDSEPVSSWIQHLGISKSNQIKLVKISHMRYQHPDLPTITSFMLDFGMSVVKNTDEEIWFGGYGPDHYVYYAKKGPKKFLGGAFEVESYEDLEKAARLERASGVEKMEGAPCGGYVVCVEDPEGLPVNLIFGMEPVLDKGNTPKKIVVNYETEKSRVGGFQRFQPGPAAVHKLGHYGLCVKSFEDQLVWYTRNFNLVPSDFLYVPSPDRQEKRKIVAVFAHIDRGNEFVDHHTFFMSTNATSHVHHCSFEVHDFDTQQLGHQWLAKKGYKPVWGIGRHILGSQIFDYWWDTTGNMVEHYADGDLVNEESPIGYGSAGDESLAVWGPEVPKCFLE